MKFLKKYFLAVIFCCCINFVLAQPKDFRMGMVLEPPHLDPTVSAAGAIDEVVYNNIFQGLTRIDKDGQVQPSLARFWEITDDKLTYTFILQNNVYFHDKQKLIAQDVVFSLNRARGTQSQNAQKIVFTPIQSIQEVSDNRVVIQLIKPVSDFLFHLAWGDAVIVKKDNHLNNKVHPIGTGPFVFHKWVRGSHVELIKNTNYWGEIAQLDKVSFHFIADTSAAVNAMLAGDIDGFANFPSPESIPQFENNNRFQVSIGNTEGETLLAINNAKKPFDNLLVRKALNFAIDKNSLVEGVMGGYGTVIGSHFSPNSSYYLDLSDYYSYQPQKAKNLLKRAGFPHGFHSSITVPPTSYARRSAEVIASQLKEVGIQLDIIPIQWAQWLQQVFQNKSYDLTIIAHTEPLDIGIYARENYYFNYYNAQFNEIMQSIEQTFQDNKKKVLFHQVQKILAEDAVNVFLFQLPKLGVWNAQVKGLWHNSPIQANDMTEVFWSNK